MKEILKSLNVKFPHINFKPGKQCSWSPASNTIIYINDSVDKRCLWALFHELSHALLNHSTYDSDLELLMMETAAWNQAKAIAAEFGIMIDDEHVQDCLDTYRDWLDRRSTCPVCGHTSLPSDFGNYTCFNCKSSWRVSESRFCRPYRQKLTLNKKTPPAQKMRATFD